jgi:hypothetical protein
VSKYENVCVAVDSEAGSIDWSADRSLLGQGGEKIARVLG